MTAFSGYEFSTLRQGEFTLSRGPGNGLTPILVVAAEETSPGCVERLEHEYALKSELDADWAARPVALTHDNGRMTLVLEDPGGTPLDRLLGRPLDVSHFLRIAIPLAGALRHVHERGLIHKCQSACKFAGRMTAFALRRQRSHVRILSSAPACVSAWNKDPVFGVIGIQSGPRDKGPNLLASSISMTIPMILSEWNHS